MPNALQLERIYQSRLKANPQDTLALYPTLEIRPSFAVVKVRPPSHGQNGNLNLAGATMLLLHGGNGQLPVFDLHYIAYDKAQEELIIGNRLKVQNQVFLRYQSDDHPAVLWPLKSMDKLDVLNPPPGWRQRAVLAVFGTANANECEVQSLEGDPDLGGAPDPCAVYCDPALEGFETWCQLHC